MTKGQKKDTKEKANKKPNPKQRITKTSSITKKMKTLQEDKNDSSKQQMLEQPIENSNVEPDVNMEEPKKEELKPEVEDGGKSLPGKSNEKEGQESINEKDIEQQYLDQQSANQEESKHSMNESLDQKNKEEESISEQDSEDEDEEILKFDDGQEEDDSETDNNEAKVMQVQQEEDSQPKRKMDSEKSDSIETQPTRVMNQGKQRPTKALKSPRLNSKFKRVTPTNKYYEFLEEGIVEFSGWEIPAGADSLKAVKVVFRFDKEEEVMSFRKAYDALEDESAQKLKRIALKTLNALKSQRESGEAVQQKNREDSKSNSNEEEKGKSVEEKKPEKPQIKKRKSKAYGSVGVAPWMTETPQVKEAEIAQLGSAEKEDPERFFPYVRGEVSKRTFLASDVDFNMMFHGGKMDQSKQYCVIHSINALCGCAFYQSPAAFMSVYSSNMKKSISASYDLKEIDGIRMDQLENIIADREDIFSIREVPALSMNEQQVQKNRQEKRYITDFLDEQRIRHAILGMRIVYGKTSYKHTVTLKRTERWGWAFIDHAYPIIHYSEKLFEQWNMFKYFKDVKELKVFILHKQNLEGEAKAQAFLHLEYLISQDSLIPSTMSKFAAVLSKGVTRSFFTTIKQHRQNETPENQQEKKKLTQSQRKTQRASLQQRVLAEVKRSQSEARKRQVEDQMEQNSDKDTSLVSAGFLEQIKNMVSSESEKWQERIIMKSSSHYNNADQALETQTTTGSLDQSNQREILRTFLVNSANEYQEEKLSDPQPNKNILYAENLIKGLSFNFGPFQNTFSNKIHSSQMINSVQREAFEVEKIRRDLKISQMNQPKPVFTDEEIQKFVNAQQANKVNVEKKHMPTIFQDRNLQQ